MKITLYLDDEEVRALIKEWGLENAPGETQISMVREWFRLNAGFSLRGDKVIYEWLTRKVGSKEAAYIVMTQKYGNKITHD